MAPVGIEERPLDRGGVRAAPMSVRSGPANDAAFVDAVATKAVTRTFEDALATNGIPQRDWRRTWRRGQSGAHERDERFEIGGLELDGKHPSTGMPLPITPASAASVVVRGEGRRRSTIPTPAPVAP